MNETPAHWFQSFATNCFQSVLRSSMKQQRRRGCNRWGFAKFDAMAIRRAAPAVANLETIRSTNDRFEQRFIEESPIITIEPHCDDKILQAHPTAFVEVEAEVCRIVTQGETDCA